MEAISQLLVGRLLNISLVAVLFLAAHFVVRMTGIGSNRHPRALVVVTIVWTAYAAWEWLVAIKTPEANIRVDLLLIWPVVLIASIWFAIRVFR